MLSIAPHTWPCSLGQRQVYMITGEDCHHNKWSSLAFAPSTFKYSIQMQQHRGLHASLTRRAESVECSPASYPTDAWGAWREVEQQCLAVAAAQTTPDRAQRPAAAGSSPRTS